MLLWSFRQKSQPQGERGGGEWDGDGGKFTCEQWPKEIFLTFNMFPLVTNPNNSKNPKKIHKNPKVSKRSNNSKISENIVVKEKKAFILDFHLRRLVFDQSYSVHPVSESRESTLSMTNGGGRTNGNPCV